jgi:hypothetical protein
MSFDTTLAFTTLHPETNGYFPLFLEDYELNKNLELSFDYFKLLFQRMPHLLTSGHFGMAFEHLWDCFHLEDLVSGFPQLFQLCFHITQGHIPPKIAHFFGVAHLLAMTKPSSGVCPIIMGETLYQFTSYALCFQFCETFVTHFSPHQFGIATKGGYDVIIHEISVPWTFTSMGCSSIGHSKCFQFSVKMVHISKDLCNKWGHHITHPLCLCILCIEVSFIL